MYHFICQQVERFIDLQIESTVTISAFQDQYMLCGICAVLVLMYIWPYIFFCWVSTSTVPVMILALIAT